MKEVWLFLTETNQAIRLLVLSARSEMRALLVAGALLLLLAPHALAASCSTVGCFHGGACQASGNCTCVGPYEGQFCENSTCTGAERIGILKRAAQRSTCARRHPAVLTVVAMMAFRPSRACATPASRGRRARKVRFIAVPLRPILAAHAAARSGRLSQLRHQRRLCQLWRLCQVQLRVRPGRVYVLGECAAIVPAHL